MTGAIVCGLAAACLISMSLLSSSRSIRMIGNFPVLGWVMLVGLVVTLPWALADGVPPSLAGVDGALLLLMAACQVGGYLLAFVALKVGKVGVVTPILATEGAVGAVFATLAGERLATAALLMLAITVVGVVVAGAADDPFPIEGERPALAVVMALAAAVVWGLNLYLMGRLSTSLPVSWIVMAPRLLGALAVGLPLLLARRMTLTRRAAPLVLLSGLAEVGVNVLIPLGARTSIAVTDVLVAQYAVITPIAAWLLFRESLGRQQVVGAALLVLGVSGLALLY